MDEKPLETSNKLGIRNEKGQFIEGHPPLEGSGHPLGQKNFDTLFNEAIKKIAKEEKLKIDDPEREMVVKAVIEALKGNYAYYRDSMDRRYGKAQERLDITTGGKSLLSQEQINELLFRRTGENNAGGEI